MSHKLLLADDSVTIQRVIELTFADEDVNVTVVGDGKQAIDRVVSERPDIVLADIGMPERDGYEVAAFIKGDPQYSGIPVILLTGAFEPLDEERARNIGCDSVLVKPFEPQMVINRVKELLNRARPRTAVAPPPQPAAPPPAPSAVPSAVLAPPPPPPPMPPPAPSPAPLPIPVHQQASAELDIPDLEPNFAPPLAAGDAKTSGGDALEDYFDRLDAAFANMGAPPPPQNARPADPREDLSGGIGELHQPPPEPAPAGEDALNSWDPDLAGDFGPARQPQLADAFAALLAAEEGHPPPPGALAFAAPMPVAEDMIEEVVRRVIARLTDSAVREAVLEVAERLVRQEIERIKQEARGSSAPQPGR